MNPELQHYLAMLDDLRREVIATLAGLEADGLNWRPIESGGADDHVTNSLSVMAAHVAGAERHWIGEMVGRQPATRHRPDEFQMVAAGSHSLVAALTAAGENSRQVLVLLEPDAIDGERQIHGHTFTVRWCILHAIEHTALHLGHMQLTRQLWNHHKEDSA